MRSQWEALQQGLVRSVSTLGARSQFQQVKAVKRPLQRFSDAGELLAYLNQPGGDLNEKDAIYAALVDVVQAGGEDVELATTLLWLGLWPALDGIYRRRQRDFFGEPDALLSEIGARFTVAIHRADLNRIHRVAATLVRNTERNVWAELERTWALEKLRAELPQEEDDDSDEEESTGDRRQAQSSPLLRTRGVSRLGQPPRSTPDEDIEPLRELLTAVVGDTADLVLGAAVYGLNLREVGERLGLNHEVTRKRYRTALKRIQEHFSEK